MSGFVENKARPEIFRLKPYVPGKPIDEVKRELGLSDIIKLASNENPLGPSPMAVEAIKETLDQLNFYPDSNCFYLKQKLAAELNVEQKQLLIGNGSDELLKLLAETFIEKDDEVIYADPSFVEYEFTATIMGAKCISIPLRDFRYDMEAVLAAINKKTKIVYICNPNNPTGTIVYSEEIDQFMKHVPEDVLVVFDEAYFEYAESEQYVSGLKYLREGKNVAVFRTFSKIYGLAAVRIGYTITTPEIAAAVERVTEPFNVNMLAQVGAIAAIDDKEHVQKSRRLNSAGKRYLYGEFEKMGLYYVPTEANFIFFDTGKDCQQVFKCLLSKGVIVRTGDIFGYPTFIRVTIGKPEENERFINELKQILGD